MGEIGIVYPYFRRAINIALQDLTPNVAWTFQPVIDSQVCPPRTEPQAEGGGDVGWLAVLGTKCRYGMDDYSLSVFRQYLTLF